MSRKDDLEQNIRECYALIRQYEAIQRDTDRPEERRRARRIIDEQWDLIEGYLDEYLPLCRRIGTPPPADIAEVAAHFEAATEKRVLSGGEGLPVTPPLGRLVRANGRAETLPAVVELRRLLVDCFDLEELRTLCFDLGVDFDSLRGEGKEAKTRELVMYFQRHSQLDRLVYYIRQHRSDIELPFE